MKRLAKAFLIFTSLAYTVFLFYVYAYFADQPKIYLDFLELSLSFTNNTLFYTGIAVPLTVVVLCFIFSNAVKKQSVGQAHYFKTERAQLALSSWSLSFAGAFNLFSAAVLSIILFANNEEGITKSGFAPFLIIGAGLLITWIIWLPIIFLRNK